ncbi:MAG: tRNA pseudouridine(38-40) synthase TruA [Chitinophagaceae bacterium]|nr:tRNA pseudouridine(38-40) synthase TruA [Chitinophagaceae bacterium]MBL0057463.1 tRNA pseudouridine(38-40) synthase TruA [Chitinophagaceae bacterium]
MARYFIEVSYKGTGFSGFQVQENAETIQSAMTRALRIYFREEFQLTGSSRTDAGVHALQNYFHFDTERILTDASYHLNAILPDDIVVKRLFPVSPDVHCRFDAIAREYRYQLYAEKDPFLKDTAFFYPYALDINLMNDAAGELLAHTDFETFSKRNSQVFTHQCIITSSEWILEKGLLQYRVKANRFLRGMVKGLVGTMLQVGRGKLDLEGFREVIISKDPARADFSVPSQGLFLVRVEFPGERLDPPLGSANG